MTTTTTTPSTTPFGYTNGVLGTPYTNPTWGAGVNTWNNTIPQTIPGATTPVTPITGVNYPYMNQFPQVTPWNVPFNSYPQNCFPQNTCPPYGYAPTFGQYPTWGLNSSYINPIFGCIPGAEFCHPGLISQFAGLPTSIPNYFNASHGYPTGGYTNTFNPLTNPILFNQLCASGICSPFSMQNCFPGMTMPWSHYGVNSMYNSFGGFPGAQYPTSNWHNTLPYQSLPFSGAWNQFRTIPQWGMNWLNQYPVNQYCNSFGCFPLLNNVPSFGTPNFGYPVGANFPYVGNIPCTPDLFNAQARGLGLVRDAA